MDLETRAGLDDACLRFLNPEKEETMSLVTTLPTRLSLTDIAHLCDSPYVAALLIPTVPWSQQPGRAVVSAESSWRLEAET